MSLKYIILSFFLITTVIALNCGHVLIDAQNEFQDETDAIQIGPAPSTPLNLISTGQSDTSATIAWEKTMSKVPVAYYEIQTNDLNRTTTVDGKETAITITDLEAATSYDFRIRSCDEKAVCSAYSPYISITTLLLVDSKPPIVPTNLTSPSKTTTTVNLAWTASTDNVGVARYEVQTNSSGTPVTVMAPTTSRTMSGLTQNTTYMFRVRACDTSNNCSAYTSNLSVTTLTAPDTTSPTVPTNLTSPSKTTTTVNLAWTASTDNVGVARYEVQTNSSGTPVTVMAPTTNRTMSGLASSTNYQFRVRSCDAANNCSAYTSNIAVTTNTAADTAAPSVPTNLTASNPTSSSIMLNWTASTDNVGVNRYEIRTNSSGTPVTVMAPTTNRVMSGLNASTSYQFQIRACDVANNCSAYSSNITAATLADEPSADVQGCSSTIRTFSNTSSSRKTVPLCANVYNSPARITLQWSNISGVTRTAVSVYRRSPESTTWGNSIATPSASGNTWSDTNVTVGTKYEYRVQMTTSAGEANGYIVSGVRVPASSYEGKVILVVDNTFQTSLASEILTLQNDYRKKGWIPKTIYVNRTATAASVKTQIVNLYNQDPTNTKAVFLLGHVPVPYSGTNQWPAGHDDHRGAWVADGYYGDTGAWTSGGGNVWYYAHGPNSSSKFSNDTFPSALEMMVGRVDMINLSGSRADPFGNIMMGFSRNETQLLSDYLNRLHNFKAGTVTPARKAIIDSDVDGDGYAVTPGSYSTFASSVDPNNIDQIAIGANPNYIGQLNDDNYLWSHGTGYGTGIGFITNGNISAVISSNIGSVFNQTFGSYFGDFDAPLNFLRGLIANDSGHTSLALTNIYSGYKHLYAHPMAMGETIGNAWKISARNTDSNYKPFRVDNASYWAGETYFSLMGDPTLTLFHPKAPSNLSINNGSSSFTLSWSAPSGGANGYYVYEILENGAGSTTSETIQKIGNQNHWNNFADNFRKSDGKKIHGSRHS
ncbi:MAG: fibronectin type III domain-containing protein [Bdellovibrionota bacterium]